jgi:hypothetical protein
MQASMEESKHASKMVDMSWAQLVPRIRPCFCFEHTMTGGREAHAFGLSTALLMAYCRSFTVVNVPVLEHL